MLVKLFAVSPAQLLLPYDGKLTSINYLPSFRLPCPWASVWVSPMEATSWRLEGRRREKDQGIYFSAYSLPGQVLTVAVQHFMATAVVRQSLSDCSSNWALVTTLPPLSLFRPRSATDAPLLCLPFLSSSFNTDYNSVNGPVVKLSSVIPF